MNTAPSMQAGYAGFCTAWRRTNFWILPVAVLGSSRNSKRRDTLKPARCWRLNDRSSSAVADAPGLNSMKAQGIPPPLARTKRVGFFTDAVQR